MITTREAAPYFYSDKLFLDPHELRRWYCPWCKTPSVKLLPADNQADYIACCALDYGYVHLPFLPARIVGKELVVVGPDQDYQLPEYFEPVWPRYTRVRLTLKLRTRNKVGVIYALTKEEV